eukprot:TRINITY_DN6484_c0_g1_i1.p1 TRINITY_DN6484_c0_g1~~TRINITY_DN6484_c0_g1_i1.p1  ORF type:complete len:719 (-),score=146.90 TRINITY_DN6484_c0_g1_i1:183-2339(-)
MNDDIITIRASKRKKEEYVELVENLDPDTVKPSQLSDRTKLALEKIDQNMSEIKDHMTGMVSKLDWHWVKTNVTFHRSKIVFIVLVSVISAVILATEHEEHLHYNMDGISSTQPLLRPINLTSTVAGYQIIIQDVESPGDSVNVTLQGYGEVEGFPGTLEWFDLSSNVLYTDDEEVTSNKVIYLSDIQNLPIALSSITSYRYHIITNSSYAIAINFEGHSLPEAVRYEVLFAALILVGLYVLIIFELFHRTMCAMIASFVALATLSKLHERPSFEMVVSWIDYETIGLLFGMMIMVGIFSQTGFFEWAAVKSYKLSKGDLWKLTVILGLFSAIVSAFLDNVTTILLIAPVTIKLCQVLGVDPVTMLLTEVISSNVGGTGTIIGDPPNIIIANQKGIVDQINFLTFSVHMMPGVILSLIVMYIYIWKVYGSKLKRDNHSSIRAEIRIWQKTLARYTNWNNEGEEEVRKYLTSRLENLIQKLEEEESKVPNIEDLEEQYQIRDWNLLIKSCCVIGSVILLFFLRSLVGLDLSLAWISIIGAMVHIFVSGSIHIEGILEKVEFGMLMFFAALFVLMETLDELGLIRWIAESLETMIGSVPEGNGRLWVSIFLLIWVSAIVSAFIDNIPYMATLAPVVVQLSENLNLPLTPLVWAIAFGTCFGGNGTLIGASANVVAVGIAEQHGYHIKFKEFFKFGFPCMLITVAVSTIYMSIFHVAIAWY